MFNKTFTIPKTNSKENKEVQQNSVVAESYYNIPESPGTNNNVFHEQPKFYKETLTSFIGEGTKRSHEDSQSQTCNISGKSTKLCFLSRFSCQIKTLMLSWMIRPFRKNWPCNFNHYSANYAPYNAAAVWWLSSITTQKTMTRKYVNIS